MSKLLADEHPQLFHYTSAAGLDGIIRSQTLWATHYAYLNDATEIRHFLEKQLPQIFYKTIRDLGYDDITASSEGKKHSNSISDTLLKSSTGNDPLAEPYLASFCTPKDGAMRVARHGLLSQWRAYGKDGGYALVFDTEILSNLLAETSSKYENTGHLFAGTVIYSSDDNQRFLNEFTEDLATMKKFLLNCLQDIDDDENLGKIFAAIMRCACRYKHWGFKEENEVRIIYIPNSKKVREFAKTDGIPINEMLRKQHIRSGANIPYVELLEGITSPTRPLPIRRVIVGPCADQERARRVRAVEILLEQQGVSAKVTASEIPYIG
jgi:hypothetical protein